MRVQVVHKQAHYRESRPERKRWETDESRWRLHIEPLFAKKGKTERIPLSAAAKEPVPSLFGPTPKKRRRSSGRHK